MTKIAVVTGGSSGIGQSIAKVLSQNNYTVYAACRNPKVEKLNDHFYYLKMDVQDEGSVKAAIKEVIQKEKQIDVLINCAGLGLNGPIEVTPIDMVQRVFDTNFFGIMRTVSEVMPHMRQRKSGFIVNISSIAGEFGLPLRGYYSASKAAVEMLTESLRMEVKQFGVKVVAVQPGDFATNISANRPTTLIDQDSPYYKMFRQIDAQVNEEVSEAKDPEEVGVGILSILNQNNPKVRYKIGPFMQKLSGFVKRVTPSKFFEKLIMNHYNIN